MTEQQRRASMTGMVAGLAATTMLFAALLSAYVVRRGIADDWAHLNIPSLLYFSIAPGAAVSVLIEMARRRSGLLLVAAAMAVLFTAAHMHSWREFAHSRTASSDFLFVLSAMIVVYAGGGVPGLISAGLRRSRPSAMAYYWHYLNALWAFLLVFLYVLR